MAPLLRRSAWLRVVCVGVLILASMPVGAAAHMPVWIDTDAAPDMPFRDKDDLFALLAAFEAPELTIRGVSLVFGNHRDLDAARSGIRDLVRRFAPVPIPVHVGAGRASDLGRTTGASTALTGALSREPLVIVALGPLTNVATVLRQRPSLVSNVTRIIAVAGRRPDQELRPRHGRLNLSDLNFESDVEAFRVVLEHGIPITLISFELSRQLWITESDLRWMRNAGGPAARWLARQSAGWLDLWAHGIGVLGFHPFDAPVVTYLLSSRLMRCDRRVPASIATAPLETWWGRPLGFRKPVLLVSEELASPYRVDYCVDIDSRAKHDLLIRINGLGRNAVREAGS